MDIIDLKKSIIPGFIIPKNLFYVAEYSILDFKLKNVGFSPKIINVIALYDHNR